MRKSSRVFLAKRSTTQGNRMALASITHNIINDKRYQLAANPILRTAWNA